MTEVQELCEKLISNDERIITMFWPPGMNDDEAVLLCDALKQNTTLKSICFDDHTTTLTGRVGSELNRTLQAHSTVKDVSFHHTRIEEFGHVWFAIAMNESLTTIAFFECHLSDSAIHGICLLLDSNAISSLILRGCTVPEGQATGLSAALRRNTSLTTIDFYDEQGGDDDDSNLLVNRDVPGMLRNNQHLHDLKEVELSPEVALETFEAAEHHESLQRLAVTSPGAYGNHHDSDHTLNVRIGRAISNMLQNTPCLVELDFAFFDMAAEMANGLAEGLAHNTLLRELILDSALIIGGISPIANGLCSNSSLRELTVFGLVEDADGVASIAQMLAVNTTLEKVSLDLDDCGMQAFATMIPNMKGLKSFEFSKSRGTEMFSPETETALLCALERNTTLIHVGTRFTQDCFSEETESKVKCLMELNRGGRKILGAEPEPPRSLWPLILDRSSTKLDVLYYFLREKPDVLASPSYVGDDEVTYDCMPCTIM